MSTPSPDWWQAVSPYLDRALDMSAEERAAWLATLRPQNADLASQLEALLREHHALIDAGFLEEALVHRPHSAPAAGDVMGAYTLAVPIGEGGMGSVWLAERNDGEIQQKVAVKFLGVGGRRPGWHARFLKERQLLASLNHPAIVHVIDAGRTDDGRPYLVMEYVSGSPIDVYARQIPIRERLELFIRVCEGVAHAHRRLIIHRDLKPSNILVDSTGQPKLLDFGIAKLLDDTGDPTATLDRVLTPRYASPEQFRGAPQTTATDVYSLGAVLYNVMTGRSPHESADGTASAAELIGGSLEIPDPRRLNPEVPADLDYIVRKALRREPDERYVSVDAFANDIRALLDSRPVEARAGDRWYRARKLLRRYRLPAAAAALIVLSLTAGLYVANRERAIAEQRFQQVRQLANEFFALDAKIQTLPGSTDARRQIVSTSIGYLEALGKEARNDRGLALEIAAAYVRVARVQGVPSGSNLGEFDEADKTLAKAERLADAALATDPTDRRALRVSADISHDRMILANGGAQDRQLVEARKTMSRVEALMARAPAGADEVVSLANLVVNVALAFHNLGRYDDATAAARRAADISGAIDSKEARRVHGRALTRLADMLRTNGDLEQALQTVRQARPIVEGAEYASEQQRMLAIEHVLSEEGMILAGDVGDGFSLGRPADAVEPFQKAFDMMEQLAATDRNDSQSRYVEVIDGASLATLIAARQPERALAVYDLCLTRLREIKPSENRALAEVEALARSSGVLCQLGRFREAKERIDSAFALLPHASVAPDELMNFKQDRTIVLIQQKATYEERTGHLDRAIETYQGLVDALATSVRKPETDLRQAVGMSDSYAELARMYRAAGRRDRAEALGTLRLKLWQQWDHRRPQNDLVTRQLQSATDAAARP